MLKKITSLFAAGTLLAGGLLVIAAPASCAADVTQTVLCISSNPISGMPLSVFSNGIRNNYYMNPEWSAGTPTWSPTVSGNFASNTFYVATVTLTPVLGQTKFNNLSANVFTSNSSCAGHSSVTSISSPAVAARANLNSITITVTFANTGTGGGGGGGMLPQTSTATSSNVTDTSATVDFATLAAAHSGVATWRVYVRNVTASPAVLLGYYDIAGSVHNLTVTGLSAGTNYNFFMADLGGQIMNGYYTGFEPGLLVTTTGSGGGSNNLQAQLTAIAQAAAAKAAAVAKAQTTLVDTFKANKPATLSDMSSSDFAVKQQVTVDRINQAVLALQAKNPGVALPIAVIKDVVAKESIVEQISTSVTQGTVQTAQLVKAGLIDSTNSVKSSVMNALKTMDPTSLNTLDKLKAAIAAQTKVAQDRYARTRAIVAKIGASK